MASQGEAPLSRNAPRDELVAQAQDYEVTRKGRVVVVDINGGAVVDTQPPTGKNPERNFKSRPEFMEALAGKIARGTRASHTRAPPIGAAPVRIGAQCAPAGGP